MEDTEHSRPESIARRMGGIVDLLATEARLAMRTLARSPGFSLAVVAVIALGVGANSAVFTALDQTVIRLLPYRDPARLVMVWEDFSAFGVPKQRVSPGTFLDWRRRSQAFEGMAAYGGDLKNLAGDGPPQQVQGLRVTANLIPLLGVRPLIGRTFAPDEEGPETRAIVLSYRLWQRRYGADPHIVGKSILANDEKQEVIGVMPEGFDYPNRDTEFWEPLGLRPEMLTRRNSHFLKVVGRLRPDRSLAQAQAEMDGIARELARLFPATNADVGIRVAPLQEEMVGDARTAFLVLIGAAACVLLIACANVGNLLLARSAKRQQEVAVRIAVGASPARIVLAMLAETMLLASMGAIVSIIVAHWSIAVLQRMVPAAMGGFVNLHLDARTLAFTVAVSAGAALAFGLAPALQSSRAIAVNTRGSIGHGNRRLRSSLVILEVAIALVLLVCAGLLIQTLIRLRAVDPGFRSPRILTASVMVPVPKYEDPDRRRQFYSEMLGRVAAIPGVISAGATSDLPYTSRGNTMSLAVEGQPQGGGVGQDALFRLVSAAYLPTIGARLVQGRFLDQRDGPDAPPVVVVNETLGRLFWPSESPLGHRIDTGTGGGTRRWMTIVGVVSDIRERGLDLAMKPGVYVPFTQTEITFFQPSEVAVLTSRDPMTIARELQDAVWSVDRDQPVTNIRTMDDIVDAELANRTQVLQLLGIFAALALGLATFGIYAVLSFLVAQRTREIGVRMAIGARSRDIIQSMLAHAARLTIAGVIVGAAAGMAATRLLSSLLYGVTPLDWPTFAGVAMLLTVVGLAAAYVPTRRAALVDPVIALRDDR